MIGGADVFLGLSAAGVLKPEMVSRMAARPLIFALANPNPEITPEDVAGRARRRHHGDGAQRLSQPGQQRPVLPHIFRGALDVGATTVNDEMKIACVRALAALARKEPSEVVARAFGEQAGGFGPSQIIPKTVRSAADRRTRAGRRQGGHGQRRGDAADHRLRRLSPAAQPVRVQVRPRHAAGLRPGAFPIRSV